MDVSPIARTDQPPLKSARNMADGLEQAFLSEMLKHAGLREDRSEFGGGTGESQFASMLNDAYAQAISERIDLKLITGHGGRK